jgi:polysaccharide biosynthesis/export protein
MDINHVTLAFADQRTGMRRWLNLSIAVLLLLFPSTVRAQQSSGKTQTNNQELMAQNGNGGSEVQNPFADDPNYVIGPQDVLNVSVWKEPDVTRTVPVRPDGKISLPLLNDVKAAGLTPAQLAAKITDSFKKYMTDPQVTVIVTEVNSQRIYIMGEVNRAGAFSLLPGMTVLQALSSAGGFTQFANVKNIYLLREENGKRVRHPFNYKEVVSGKNSEQNTVLKTGDTIVVP